MSVDRLFIGVFPCGISYADRQSEVNGAYKKVAFLPYATLALEFRAACPEELRDEIVADAARIQAKRGQWFQISASGQGIILGGKL